MKRSCEFRRRGLHRYHILVITALFQTGGIVAQDDLFRHTGAIFRSGYYLQLFCHVLQEPRPGQKDQ
jgi:hypothetical protein